MVGVATKRIGSRRMWNGYLCAIMLGNQHPRQNALAKSLVGQAKRLCEHGISERSLNSLMLLCRRMVLRLLQPHRLGQPDAWEEQQHVVVQLSWPTSGA